MKKRRLGKTGFNVSEISLGTWQVGGKWGTGFDNKNADIILNTAIDEGINFIDTADVYENGLSEAAVGRVIRSRKERVHIATKCGRKIQPHVAEAYNPTILRKFIDDSLRRTGLERLDLIQLHCPPTQVYYRPEIFRLFDDMTAEGKILHLGVSIEKVEEGLKAIEYPNVSTVQIIFNIFRQRPASLFFKEAKKKDVGIIIRVPLASGLLTGLLKRDTQFAQGDHRQFNRLGEAFDKGETFSGVDYALGLKAVKELKKIFPNSTNLAPLALKWILQFSEVSCVIPGASHVKQLHSNVSVNKLPDLTMTQIQEMNKVYEKYIKPEVFHLW